MSEDFFIFYNKDYIIKFFVFAQDIDGFQGVFGMFVRGVGQTCGGGGSVYFFSLNQVRRLQVTVKKNEYVMLKNYFVQLVLKYMYNDIIKIKINEFEF